MHVGTFFLIVPNLDCSREFAHIGVPIIREHPTWHDGPMAVRIGFSRIVFSRDGQFAYAARADTCGDLCGYGHDTVWRLENG
jgi:hypothetical protein